MSIDVVLWLKLQKVYHQYINNELTVEQDKHIKEHYEDTGIFKAMLIKIGRKENIAKVKAENLENPENPVEEL